MTIRVHNTLTREKEPFETIEADRVRMYVCGPTVYDRAHVGHAMSTVVYDVIRRYLEYRGYKVRHVMNYTDVEDKVILRAKDLGVAPLDLAERYIRDYDQHLIDLNILPPHERPRASEEIDTIIEMVEGLLEKGYAYEREGDVFFRVGKDEDYGKLSGRRKEEMRAGARLDVDQRKEDPADFALWKAAKEGEPSWHSPWGLGRPGWHIECSAMNLRYLGEQIDIHGGGVDLIFPHHENELAQTESLTGKPFVRFWIHNGMLQLRGEKMSKSLGNLIAVEEFLAQHEADAFRMLVLNSQYRGPLTFNDEVVAQAESALDRLRSALRPSMPAEDVDPAVESELADLVEGTYSRFETAMDDDFNTAGALGGLFDLVRGINQARDAGASLESLESAQRALRELAGVLGLELKDERDTRREAEPFIELLIQVREELRTEKQWELADFIRHRLSDLGIALEDSKDGTYWRSV
jgi:cysteinyl-tRNA synthetase